MRLSTPPLRTIRPSPGEALLNQDVAYVAPTDTNAGLVALALYGALQAVDGVALKQAVTAWMAAPEAEQAARFASAENIRWLELRMRS